MTGQPFTGTARRSPKLVFDAAAIGPRFRDPAAVVAAFNDLLERLRGVPGLWPE